MHVPSSRRLRRPPRLAEDVAAMTDALTRISRTRCRMHGSATGGPDCFTTNQLEPCPACIATSALASLNRKESD